ncbi:hypothetical protein V9T40_002721 [Parthenolecanium corni]|uniref:histone acetyltransferase n=1 Tax=Parthenolecanium corni TaxID=536013 RepID=A0AAN9Y5W0_9HEMI
MPSANILPPNANSVERRRLIQQQLVILLHANKCRRQEQASGNEENRRCRAFGLLSRTVTAINVPKKVNQSSLQTINVTINQGGPVAPNVTVNPNANSVIGGGFNPSTLHNYIIKLEVEWKWKLEIHYAKASQNNREQFFNFLSGFRTVSAFVVINKDGYPHKMDKFEFDVGDGTLQPTVNQTSPQETRYQSILRCVTHVSQCRDVSCRLQSCLRLKRLILHTEACENKFNGKCLICKTICFHHAKYCQDTNCGIPKWSTAKEKLKLVKQLLQQRLQHQQPLRRRMAATNSRITRGSGSNLPSTSDALLSASSSPGSALSSSSSSLHQSSEALSAFLIKLSAFGLPVFPSKINGFRLLAFGFQLASELCSTLDPAAFATHARNDPREFIYEFFPLQPEWQLLKNPISLHDFEELPFVRSLFFKYGLYFPDSNTKAVMRTDSTGAATVRIAMPATLQSSSIFHYNLKRYENDGDTFDGVSLKRFVMQDFDLCVSCYNKDRNSHKMETGFDLDDDSLPPTAEPVSPQSGSNTDTLLPSVGQTSEQSEYYHLLAEESYKIIKELDKRKPKRKEKEQRNQQLQQQQSQDFDPREAMPSANILPPNANSYERRRLIHQQLVLLLHANECRRREQAGGNEDNQQCRAFGLLSRTVTVINVPKKVNQSSLQTINVAINQSGPVAPNVTLNPKANSVIGGGFSVLTHASQCRDVSCRLQSCLRMKRLIRHPKACKKKLNGKCLICKIFIALCLHHAIYCQDTNCGIPKCSTAKEKLKLVKQQRQQRLSASTAVTSSDGGHEFANYASSPSSALSSSSSSLHWTQQHSPPTPGMVAELGSSTGTLIPCVLQALEQVSINPSSEGNVNNSQTKEWHKQINSELREDMVKRLINAIHLESFVRKAESDIYYMANSKTEYYQLVAEKYYKINDELAKYIRKRKEENRRNQLAPQSTPQAGDMRPDSVFGPTIASTPNSSGQVTTVSATVKSEADNKDDDCFGGPSEKKIKLEPMASDTVVKEEPI